MKKRKEGGEEGHVRVTKTIPVNLVVAGAVLPIHIIRAFPTLLILRFSLSLLFFLSLLFSLLPPHLLHPVYDICWFKFIVYIKCCHSSTIPIRRIHPRSSMIHVYPFYYRSVNSKLQFQFAVFFPQSSDTIQHPIPTHFLTSKITFQLPSSKMHSTFSNRPLTTPMTTALPNPAPPPLLPPSCVSGVSATVDDVPLLGSLSLSTHRPLTCLAYQFDHCSSGANRTYANIGEGGGANRKDDKDGGVLGAMGERHEV